MAEMDTVNGCPVCQEQVACANKEVDVMKEIMLLALIDYKSTQEEEKKKNEETKNKEKTVQDRQRCQSVLQSYSYSSTCQLTCEMQWVLIGMLFQFFFTKMSILELGPVIFQLISNIVD